MRTRLVGILNLTPDSFSDGGAYPHPVYMMEAARTMAASGAAAVDVGAESTRPGATALTAEEEWERLAPFAREVMPECRALGLAVSIDTRHAETAARMLERGAGWVNDVSGFSDPAMRRVVRESDCVLVLMHSLSVPADPSVTLPPEADTVATLREWAAARLDTLENEGISRRRVMFDPGIGFGKTAAQSWDILRRAHEFKSLGVPLLIGHSRKSFLQSLDTPGGNREDTTLGVSAFLAVQGVEYLRVHDVPRHAAILRAMAECGA